MTNELKVSAEIQKRVDKVWTIVFRSSNKVLVDAKIYGFDGLSELPSPNIHDMVRLLRVLGAMIDALYEMEQPYEQQRQLLNSKNQITNMERLASALAANRQDDFDKALQDLEAQCVI